MDVLGVWKKLQAYFAKWNEIVIIYGSISTLFAYRRFESFLQVQCIH